jgi:hypothetical protein
MWWPDGLRCDVIDVPTDFGCGVIAHLAQSVTAVAPIASLGDRLLFLVELASTASLDLRGLTDVRQHADVGDFPLLQNDSHARDCWLIPPAGSCVRLPLAATIIDVIHSAQQKYRSVNAAPVR